MSNRRKTAARVAREDQGLAAARDHARRNPGTPVFFVAHADTGTQCCWCDCPYDGKHTEPGYVCPGCPEPATAVIRILADKTGPDQSYPLCGRHELAYAADMHEAFGKPAFDVHRY